MEELSADRRRFLVAGAAAAAIIATQPWRYVIEFVETPIGDVLAELLPPGESARRVGEAYLRQFPEAASRHRLVADLVRSLDVPTTTDRTDVAALAVHAIRRELDSRTVIRLDGWIVAPTEARLAALATVSAR